MDSAVGAATGFAFPFLFIFTLLFREFLRHNSACKLPNRRFDVTEYH